MNFSGALTVELARDPCKLSILLLRFYQTRGDYISVCPGEGRKTRRYLFDIFNFAGNSPEGFRVNAAGEFVSMTIKNEARIGSVLIVFCCCTRARSRANRAGKFAGE